MQIDISLVLISAVLGGIFGGAAGFAGYLVGKRFPAKSQLITTICTVAGCAAALALSPMVKSILIEGDSEERDIVRVDQEIRSASRLFAAIADGWPTEYRSFLSTIAAPDKQLDQATAERLANEFTTNLRKSNAGLAWYSNDAGLREYFRIYQAFLADLNERGGKQLCATVMAQGPGALGERSAEYLTHLDGMGEAMVKLLVNGRTRRDDGGEPLSPASDGDIIAFERFVFDRTGEEGLPARMASSQDPDLCSVGIRVFDALSEFAPDQPQGRVMRSTTFFNIVST